MEPWAQSPQGDSGGLWNGRCWLNREGGNYPDPSLGIPGPQIDAGRREEAGGQVRCTDQQAAHGRNASNYNSTWQSSQDLAQPPGCQDQAPDCLASTSEKSARDLTKADRVVRHTAEGQSRQDPGRLQGRHDLSPNAPEAQCAGIRSCASSCLYWRRRGRGDFSGWRGERTQGSSSQTPPAVHQGLCQRSCEPSFGRGGHGRDATHIKAASFPRTWRWAYVVILGSGCLSPSEIGHHVPSASGGIGTVHWVEAYDKHQVCCAASPFESSSMCPDDFEHQPLHSIVFEDDCMFPFEALHHAYCLQLQVQDALPAIPISLQGQRPSSCRRVRPSGLKQVTFFPTIELVGEIDDGPIRILHEGALKDTTGKPWHLGKKQPLQSRLEDEHTQPAARALHTEYPGLHQPADRALFPLDEQPDHIQELDAALQEYGDLLPPHNERAMTVLTWFLHGDAHRECLHPRAVRLHSDFLEWNGHLRAAWRDLIDPVQALHIHVVLPEPPIGQWETHVAQVLMFQAPQPLDRAAIFSVVYYADATVAIQRLARFSMPQITLPDCINAANVPLQVRHRPIQGYIGWIPIRAPPSPPVELRDAASVVLHVRPAIDNQQTISTDHFPPAAPRGHDHGSDALPRSRSRSPRRDQGDESSLMARQPRPRLDEPSSSPDLPDDVSEDSSGDSPIIGPDEPTQAFIAYRLRVASVPIRLRTTTPNVFMFDLQRVLQLNPHELQAVHHSRFVPDDLRAGDVRPLMLHMSYDFGPGDDRRLVIVDLEFHNHAPQPKTNKRFVTRLPQRISRTTMLQFFGVDQYCAQVQHQCIVWLNGIAIPHRSRALHFIQHADWLRVALPPFPETDSKTCQVARCLFHGYDLHDVELLQQVVDTDEDWPIDAPGTDQLQLLQQDARLLRSEVSQADQPCEVVTLVLDTLLPPNPLVHVDFSSVHRLRDEVLGVPIVTLCDWPPLLEFGEHIVNAMSSLDAPYWTHAKAFHFYVDGSKVQGQAVGAGIALFVETAHGFFFGGCLAKHVQHAEHAYLGEHAAMVWALLWALQCSDWMINELEHQVPDFIFHFDATNTGHQAAGWWRSKVHKKWHTLMRSLAHILEHRHGARHVQWCHVRAHSQHPWNDLVDLLAKYASMYPYLVSDCEPWIHWLDDPHVLASCSGSGIGSP